MSLQSSLVQLVVIENGEGGGKERGIAGIKENKQGFMAKGSSETGPIRNNLMTTSEKQESC